MLGQGSRCRLVEEVVDVELGVEEAVGEGRDVDGVGDEVLERLLEARLAEQQRAHQPPAAQHTLDVLDACTSTVSKHSTQYSHIAPSHLSETGKSKCKWIPGVTRSSTSYWSPSPCAL